MEGVIDKLRLALGRQKYEVKLKDPHPDTSTIGVDMDVDTRYAPTKEGRKFLDITSAAKALKHLQYRYSILSNQENEYYQNPSSVPSFPKESVEYSMQLDRFTMHMQNRLGRFNQLRKEGTKLLEELKTFNQQMQFDQINNGQAGRIRRLKALDVLDNATTIAFLKNMKINLHEDMTIYETDYWNR